MNLFRLYKRISLVYKLITAMILGAICGVIFGEKIVVIEPLGKLFLNLLKMATLPLIVANLISGIASLKDIKTFGRLGSKIVIYYLFTTVIAMVMGTISALQLKPGVGFQLTGNYDTVTQVMPTFGDTLLNLFPSNIFAALTNGRYDQVVFFSAIVGIAMLLLEKDDRDKLTGTFSRISKLFIKLIGIIMQYAPIGIFALFSSIIGRYGSMIVGFLAKFVIGMYASVLLMFVLYSLLLYIFTKKTPIYFVKKAVPIMVTAVATNSSVASIPVNLQCADDMGVPRSISSFTIPLGAQINKDGNGILLSMMFIFASQAIGAPITVAIFLKFMLLALILTTGAGGVAGGGIVAMTILMDSFGLPFEVVGIIAAIAPFIDPGQTIVNVVGDLAGTNIVASSEKNNIVEIGS